MESNRPTPKLYEKLSPIELEKVAQRVAQGFATAAIAGEFKTYRDDIEDLIALEEMQARIDLWRWNVEASPIERLVHAEEERYFALLRAVGHDRPGAIATASRFIAELRALVDQAEGARRGREFAHPFAHLGPATPPSAPLPDERLPDSRAPDATVPNGHAPDGHAPGGNGPDANASSGIAGGWESADADEADEDAEHDPSVQSDDRSDPPPAGMKPLQGLAVPGSPAIAGGSRVMPGPGGARRPATGLPRHFVSLPAAAAAREACPHEHSLIDPAWPMPHDPLIDPATILDPLLRAAAASGMRGRLPGPAGDDVLLKPLGGRKPETEAQSLLVLRSWLGPLGLLALRMVEYPTSWDGLEHIVLRDAEAAIDDGTRFELDPEERSICARADAAFDAWSRALTLERPRWLDAGANDNRPPASGVDVPTAVPAGVPTGVPRGLDQERMPDAEAACDAVDAPGGGSGTKPGPGREPEKAPEDPKIWAREPVPRHLRPGR